MNDAVGMIEREAGPSWARPDWPLAELDELNLGLDPTQATIEKFKAAVADRAAQTTTDPLAIRCSATPTAGPAPLTVAFGLDVANAIGTIAVSISYGDGQTGTDASARHVYSSAGDYMAALTVSAGLESARCSVPIAVAAAVAPSPSPSVPNPPGNQGPGSCTLVQPAL